MSHTRSACWPRAAASSPARPKARGAMSTCCIPTPAWRPDMRRRPFIRLIGASAMATPFAAMAQKATHAVVGLLTPVNFDADVFDAIRKGLGERGYVEGRN